MRKRSCCRFIEDGNDEASRGQPATRMMTTCSMKASSDNESDASRSQRQAVGGAPQARSGVERDNQRRKNGGMRKVVRSSVQMHCSDEAQPSTSQQIQQMRRQCRGQLSEVSIGPTRATLDQRRRDQRALLKEKTKRIQHLKKRCEQIAVDVNNQFDQLSTRLLKYHGDPNWLIECFSIVFNENAKTVLNHEAEVRILYKEIAQLKQAVYKRGQMRRNGPSVSAVQRQSANVHSNVQEAKEQPVVFGFPVESNPFRILDNEIHLNSESLCPESDEEEDYVPLLDPRRHRTGNSVSSLSDTQESITGSSESEHQIKYQSAYQNNYQQCPSPSNDQAESDQEIPVNPENTPTEKSPTMSSSQWNPREPPTFSGRLKEDVHQWTAIVTQYFATVPGTNQQQLTYAVSLLRGNAFEWYNTEVKKDNPIDWKSLADALILRFGSAARSKRAFLKIM